MRLLEFGREESNVNPPLTGAIHPGTPGPSRQTTQTAGSGNPVPLTPLDGIKLKQAVRKPVDLGHLKQRIDRLERRMRAQSEKLDEYASVEKLDQLKQRMLRLEQCLQGELGAARQREHTLLDMLQQPPIIQRLKHRGIRFWQQQLPAAINWLQRAAQVWWRDSQPCWWPQFVRAWQTSLEQARSGAKRSSPKNGVRQPR